MVEEASAAGFNIETELARIQEGPVMESVKNFLDAGTPFSMRVTTAQQICNMNDHKDVALVFDMRSATAFNECSLDKSVNFDVERFSEDIFINWAQKSKQIETDQSIFLTKYSIDWMKKRKRRFCYIIPCQQTSFLERYLMKLSLFGDEQKTLEALEECASGSAQDKLDLLSLRNSLLLYRALKKERVSEAYISL